jgi:hypothetical protein
MSKDTEDDDGYVKPLSFLEMVKNFKETTKEFINNGGKLVEPMVYTNRLGKCNDCEHLIREKMRCGACGCLLEAKAKMKSAHCPQGKWENGMPDKNDKK